MASSSEPQPSSGVEEVIRDEIRRNGPITFHRFVELCLYHPQFGYYNAAKIRLGKEGDFYTSAHTSPVFGRLLARHVYNIWLRSGSPPRFHLIELGAGEGLLASELLAFTRLRFP